MRIQKFVFRSAIFLFTLNCAAPCNAQTIGDVFDNALSKVSGFNGWLYHAVWTGESKRPEREWSPRYAGSLKYGPFNIGPKLPKVYNITVSRTYPPGQEIFDSTVTDENGEIVFKERLVSPFTTIPIPSPSSQTYQLTQYEQINSFTLAFGYSYQPAARIQDTNYDVEFPIGGFFIQGIVRPLPDFKYLVVGVGGSLFSVTEAKVYKGTDHVALMSVPTYFAPQIFAGIGYPMPRPLSGLQAFADVGYEWGTSLDPTFDPKEEGQTIETFRPTFPKNLDFSNWYIRFGLSLNATVPD